MPFPFLLTPKSVTFKSGWRWLLKSQSKSNFEGVRTLITKSAVLKLRVKSGVGTCPNTRWVGDAKSPAEMKVDEFNLIFLAARHFQRALNT